MTDLCANCDAPLKIGMISSNVAFTGPELKLINMSGEEPLAAACTKCGGDGFAEAKLELQRELTSARSTLTKILPYLPIVSLQNPHDWKYTAIGVVTAQTVTGTGIFSDVASAFTDVFGTQSNTYNSKLREGENLCKLSLRSQTAELGGNAILAVDVDYAEVGGQRAMLMVCMTGTAVNITNTEIVDADFGSRSEEAKRLVARIREVSSVLTKAGCSVN